MKRLPRALLVTALLVAPRAVSAHISIVSGVAASNATQEIVFGVGHGCEGADTNKVRIEIPAGVTSVRPMRSDFGKASVEKDAAGTITAVAWQKADADALDADLAYYKLVVRLKTPDKPYTSLFFVAHQTCRAMDGALSTVDWSMKPGDAVPDGGESEPAPTLLLAPAHKPGWNKLVVALAVTDLASTFGDAQIVWKDAAAWSPSATTTDLIKATPGVTALTALVAGDTIWVRY
jgi:periplasmic copper chaperone A